MLIKVKIKGKTPLLMCKFAESALNGERDKNALPREEAELLAYRGKKNNLIIPSHCIFSSIVEAGKHHKLGKNKVTTLKSSLVPAGMSILETECDLGTKEFEVDSRSVVVPATKGRIMRHRPRLDSWKTEFTLDINTSMFSEKFVRKLVDDAGEKCGILAYRPTCKGWFGRFSVIEWKVLKS